MMCVKCYSLTLQRYCKRHRCKLCTNSRLDKSEYCYMCKCTLIDCVNYRIDGFLYCSLHKCMEYNCEFMCDMDCVNPYCVLHQ